MKILNRIVRDLSFYMVQFWASNLTKIGTNRLGRRWAAMVIFVAPLWAAAADLQTTQVFSERLAAAQPQLDAKLLNYFRTHSPGFLDLVLHADRVPLTESFGPGLALQLSSYDSIGLSKSLAALKDHGTDFLILARDGQSNASRLRENSAIPRLTHYRQDVYNDLHDPRSSESAKRDFSEFLANYDNAKGFFLEVYPNGLEWAGQISIPLPKAPHLMNNQDWISAQIKVAEALSGLRADLTTTEIACNYVKGNSQVRAESREWADLLPYALGFADDLMRRGVIDKQEHGILEKALRDASAQAKSVPESSGNEGKVSPHVCEHALDSEKKTLH